MITLTEGVLKSMVLSKLKITLCVLVALAIIGTSSLVSQRALALLVHHAEAAEQEAAGPVSPAFSSGGTKTRQATDAIKCTERFALSGFSDDVVLTSFSPDGKTIVTANHNPEPVFRAPGVKGVLARCEVVFWDPATQKERWVVGFATY